MKAKVIKTEENIDVEQITEALFRDTARQGIYERIYEESELEFDKPKESVVDGWVARDRNGDLSLYRTYPERQENLGYWRDGNDYWDFPNDYFPSVTWKSEPLHVKLTITPIEECPDSSD